MSLDDASKKMSKSNPNPGSYIALLDSPDVIRKKLSRAVTDSGKEIKYDPKNKPEVSNLISIYAHCANVEVAAIEARYEGQGYGAFKKDVAEAIVAVLEPLQQRYRDIRASGEIGDILRKGAAEAAEAAAPTLRETKRRMGFLLP